MSEQRPTYRTVTSKSESEFQIRVLADEIDTAQDIAARVLAMLKSCDDLVDVRAGTVKRGRKGEWITEIKASLQLHDGRNYD